MSNLRTQSNSFISKDAFLIICINVSYPTPQIVHVSLVLYVSDSQCVYSRWPYFL